MFHIPELTDQVIDHLFADGKSLRTCALVARSWVPSAQYHIFFSVTIKRDSTCRRLCDIIASAPRIGGYIRIIYIYFEAWRPIFDSLRDLHVREPRQLTIVNCPHTAELARIEQLLAHPGLTDIRFFSGTSMSRTQLAYLAGARTAPLGNLLLYSASDTPATEDGEADARPVPRPLAVSILDVSGEAMLVTEALADRSGPLDIRNLDALTFDSADIQCLPRILNVCGLGIVVLDLVVSLALVTNTVDIGQNVVPFLVDLRLYDIGADTLPALPPLLAQLGPTSPLRALRLAPRRGSDGAPSVPFAPTPENRALWSAVDEILSALPDLASVTVEDVWTLEPATVGVRFAECFPHLVRRGVLKMPPRLESHVAAAAT